MSDFDFIIDNIVFSFSSLTTYETCPYSFRLTYIDKCSREDNFFGQYGTLIHETMFQYFSKALDMFELSGYFTSNYNKFVTVPAPPFPIGMEENYKNAGLTFFDNFSFDIEKYDIIINEEKIEFDFPNGIKFVAKPDLVLLERESGEYTLFDYKSSAPFRTDKYSGKEITDTKKLAGYYKQMYIYTYALRNHKFIPIDKIILWFTRPSRQVKITSKIENEDKAILWLEGQIEQIKNDNDFFPCDVKKNSYFCNNLCSVRTFCKFRLEA